jgi:hypothetical protein
MQLPPLAERDDDRLALFDAACRRFAEIYQIANPPTLRPAGQISDPIYTLPLGLHMAALAAIDAHVNAVDLPSKSSDLSRYLLDRERLYWLRLHGEQALPAAARIVFVAALSGPLPHPDGTALLEHTGLPETARVSAQQLLDMHSRCYPPGIPNTVLEPLYPDRLAIAWAMRLRPRRHLVCKPGGRHSSCQWRTQAPTRLALRTFPAGATIPRRASTQFPFNRCDPL